jgi:hypothetical protein
LRVTMSPSLSAFVAARIASYLAEATEYYQQREAPEVSEFAALPLIRHWSETIGLRADGEIVRWSNDDNFEPDPGVKPVEARYDWLAALVHGARRYPELCELLPRPGPIAVPCQCTKHPEIYGKFICPECCDLGWVQAVGEEPGAAR